MFEIYIDDIIGEDFFGEGITATYVRDMLKQAGDGNRVLVRINSPGGSVFEAASILTHLSQHKGGIDVQVDGLAASAASYIAMVGDKVAISDGGMIMIHDPWSIVVGNSKDMQKESDLLNKIADNLATAYVNRSGKTREEVRDAMIEETWLTARDAVEFGLADEVISTIAKAFVVPDELGYKNAPRPKEKPPHAKPASVAAMRRRLSLTRAKLSV